MFTDKDPIAEGHRAHREKEKAASYKARVVGKRVMVTADLDFGQVGTVIDVSDAKQLRVRLDFHPELPLWFERAELAAVR